MVFKNGKTKITGANSMQELQVCKKFMSEQLEKFTTNQQQKIVHEEEFKIAVLNFACTHPLIKIQEHQKIDLKSI